MRPLNRGTSRWHADRDAAARRCSLHRYTGTPSNLEPAAVLDDAAIQRRPQQNAREA
jgi:hypothetical protein